MENFKILSSQVDIDNLNKDKDALDEYLKYVKNNFLKVDNYNQHDNILVKESFDRFKYLVDNKYYSNFFKYYKEDEIYKILEFVYSYNFKFKSFMSAYQFYNDYALKSDDKKIYYESYEDAIIAMSLYIARNDITQAIDFAKVMINQEYQPATPTFLNARKKKRGELVSCFLLDIDDSLNSIMYQISQAAQLSKIGGGVALNLSKLRAKGESIKGIANATKGVIPVMKILEDLFSYVDQMGQRKGAGAVYLNIFHYDIIDFLDTKKINADEKSRSQTLSMGVIIPNKFIELCRLNKDICLFAPYSVFKLYGKHLDDMNMDEMYDELCNHSDVIKQIIPARDLLNKISTIQFESGYPYLMFRDNANDQNPLKGLESIKMTNLCCFTGDTEVLTLDHGLISFNNLIKKNISNIKVISAKESESFFKHYIDESEYYESKWILENNNAKVLFTGIKDIIKLTLSNGDIIKCTGDHKLALLRGGYIEASKALGSYLFTKNLSNKIYVKCLELYKKDQKTYCLNVENNNNFFISGGYDEYLVHNCEIFQSQKLSKINNGNINSDIGYDVNCILGSLNIVNVMNNKSIKESVHTAIQMLTNVSNITSIETAESVKKANEMFRSVGLGAMNLHGYFVSNNIPYESEEAKDFCNIFFMMMNYYSLEKSNMISKETEKTFYGFEKSEYKNGNYFNQYINNDFIPITDKAKELFKDIYIPSKEDWKSLKHNIQQYGLYNSYRLAIAPTGKISYLQNSTQSIMPITQHIEERYSNNRLMYYPMPFLSKDNQLFYKLAYNIDMMKMIDLVSIIQKHIDQGISTTLFITSKYSTRDLQKLYVYAHHKGLKSLYYTRVKNISYEEECESCAV